MHPIDDVEPVGIYQYPASIGATQNPGTTLKQWELVDVAAPIPPRMLCRQIPGYNMCRAPRVSAAYEYYSSCFVSASIRALAATFSFMRYTYLQCTMQYT